MAKFLQQILFVFAIVFVLSVAAKPQFPQAQQCPANQEWKTCGTACPLECGEPAARFCTLQCKIGCQCKDGYLLKPNGDCVLSRDC